MNDQTNPVFDAMDDVHLILARRPAEVALESPSTPVPYQSGWITLDNGIAVQLTPGTALRSTCPVRVVWRGT